MENFQLMELTSSQLKFYKKKTALFAHQRNNRILMDNIALS
jgi:hypothetical protein